MKVLNEKFCVRFLLLLLLFVVVKTREKNSSKCFSFGLPMTKQTFVKKFIDLRLYTGDICDIFVLMLVKLKTILWWARLQPRVMDVAAVMYIVYRISYHWFRDSDEDEDEDDVDADDDERKSRRETQREREREKKREKKRKKMLLWSVMMAVGRLFITQYTNGWEKE